MPDSMKQDGLFGKHSSGLYGSLAYHGNPMASDGSRDGNVRTELQTSMRVARGVSQREQRNHSRINSVFSTNLSPVFRGPGTPSGSGLKYFQPVYAPSAQAYLHLGAYPERNLWAQTPQQIMLAHRKNANRMRTGRIEA